MWKGDSLAKEPTKPEEDVKDQGTTSVCLSHQETSMAECSHHQTGCSHHEATPIGECSHHEAKPMMECSHHEAMPMTECSHHEAKPMTECSHHEVKPMTKCSSQQAGCSHNQATPCHERECTADSTQSKTDKNVCSQHTRTQHNVQYTHGAHGNLDSQCIPCSKGHNEHKASQNHIRSHIHPHPEQASSGARHKSHAVLNFSHDEKHRERKKKTKLWSSFKFKGKFSRHLRKASVDNSFGGGLTGCVCTSYRKTDRNVDRPEGRSRKLSCDSVCYGSEASSSRNSKQSVPDRGNKPIEEPRRRVRYVAINLDLFDPDMFPTEDPDEVAREQRLKEMQDGIDIDASLVRHLHPSILAANHSTATMNQPNMLNDNLDEIFDTQLTLELPNSSHDISVLSDRSSNTHNHVSHVDPQENLPILPILPPAPHDNQSGGYPLLSAMSAPRPHTAPANSTPASRSLNYEHQSGLTNTAVHNTNDVGPQVHTQVDYVHCLVPDLQQIYNSVFYWGVMDRYGAETLLENKPEGTFLLRDSAQEEFLFSVSFRRYGRTLHARIEQWSHKFSFDSHDPGVFASDTVSGLIEHYKDPSCCMFFEPMLTIPLARKVTFDLQQLARSVICSHTTYDGTNYLPLPHRLKEYLKYYHYKQKVRVRRFDGPLSKMC